MARLGNAKHEAFAYSVAKGMGIADAYVYAGYNDSPPSATRLSKKPEVAARIEELRDEMRAKAKAIIEAPTEENAKALAEDGLTLEWCMQQFREIAEEARSAGQFAPATAAIKHIQNILEIKNAGDPDEESAEEKYSLREIENIGNFLSALPKPDELPVKVINAEEVQEPLPELPALPDADD